MKSKPASQPVPDPATTSARRGKIARLPADLRHEINQRLDDGLDAASLLRWLNALKPVRRILREHFHGEPISGQNLSSWRNGGFRDWQREQQSCALAERLQSTGQAVDHSAGTRPLSDWIGTALSLQLAASVQALEEDKELDAQARWSRLKELLHELERLRRGDHRAIRTRICRERWEADVAQRRQQAEAEQREREKKKKLAVIGWLERIMLRATMGGGRTEESVWQAALMEELAAELQPGTYSKFFDGTFKDNPGHADTRVDPAFDWFIRLQSERQERLARVQRREEQEAAAKKEAQPRAKAVAPDTQHETRSTEPPPTAPNAAPETATTHSSPDSCTAVPPVPGVPSAPGQSRLIKVAKGCSDECSDADHPGHST